MRLPEPGQPSHVRACNLCGADDAEPLLVKDGWPIVRCRRCGLVYVGAVPTREELERFYGRGYFEGEVFADYTAEREARLHEGRVRARRVARLEPAGRLLDVGCAAGYFLAAASARYAVRGVEISAYAAGRARADFGLDVVTGELADAGFDDDAFDVVTMWDTIEHLVDPSATIAEAARIVRPGGLIAISTGNVEGRLARRGLERWSLLAPPGHLFFFSPATLTRMLGDHGFEVVRRIGDGIVSARPRLRRLPVTLPLGQLGLGNTMTLFARRAG